MSTLKVKRIYDASDSSDGKRLLVDRLWPRGISKENAQLTEWMKEIAPSNELRVWYGHDLGKADQESDPRRVDQLRLIKKWADEGPVTLLYASRERERNHAVQLKEWIDSM